MNVLSKIFAEKELEISERKRATSLADLRAKIWDIPAPIGFRQALFESTRPLALIAEVKKASPSQGLIRPNFDAREVAQAYENAGASALSVLTDSPNFQGSLDNLRISKECTKLPCLRKDFVNDPYQVYESRAWGADAVLLILAALTPAQAEDLFGLIRQLGMDALVEVHSRLEVDMAFALGADLVGVNNRDLATFKTDLSISEELIPLLGTDVLKVSESALQTPADLERVRAVGARAVLIGTAFCAAVDIESKVRELMRW